MTEDQTYNGWTNRATWNCYLWLTGHDEGIYHASRDLVKRYKSDIGAEIKIKALCREMWGRKTPDGDRLAEVDWSAIVEALRED